MMHKMYCTIEVNGVECPVTNFFDIDGNELAEDAKLGEADKAVVLLPDGQWLVTEINIDELRPLN